MGGQSENIEIYEEIRSVFIAICHDCGHVIAVKRTLEDIEREKALHRCHETYIGPDGSKLYLSLT